MPAYNGTGPQGAGPMTGRGMGPCGYGYGRGRGMGSAMGMGRFFGCCPAYPQKVSKEDEKKMLNEELGLLKEEISDIEKRLTEHGKE